MLTRGMATTMLLTIGIYFLLLSNSRLCSGSVSTSQRDVRSASRGIHLIRSPPTNDIVQLIPREEYESNVKREFNDYGHLRFGKRGSGGSAGVDDDYGYMRFGRGQLT